jgi:hypothetical protein
VVDVVWLAVREDEQQPMARRLLSEFPYSQNIGPWS